MATGPGVLAVGLMVIHSVWAGLTVDNDQVVYLGFDRYNHDVVYDNSKHNNVAQLANGATTTNKESGACGNCAEIIGGNIILNGKTFVGIPYMQITIAMQIKLEDTSGTFELFETIGAPPRSLHTLPQFQLEAVDGRVRWFHRNENKTTVFSIVTDGPVITREKWVHVACTYNGLTGDAKIYIDGALAKQEIADPGVFLSLDWTGYAGIGKQGGDKQLRGYVDEFYIYNKTLSPVELKSLIESCKDMVLHLSFEKIQGNTTFDSSGLNNDAVLTKGSAVPPGPPPPPVFVNGSCGGGTMVSGGAGEIKLDGKTFRNKPTDGVTVALWVNVSSIKGVHYLFDTIGGHSLHKHDQYKLALNEGAVIWDHHNEYDKEIFNVLTDPIVIGDQWTHIAATYNAQSGLAKIYVDGSLMKQGKGQGQLSEDWDDYAAFGRHEDKTASDFLDEIYMFNRELEPYEIKTLYESCNFGAARKQGTDTVVYFGFDRVSGNTVYDDSGNDENGELTSLATITKTPGNCGKGLLLQGGNILLNGYLIKRRPLFGITVAVWLKLDTNRGSQEIFTTINPNGAINKHAQYILEVNDGKVRWYHNNEKGETVFSATTTNAVVPAGTWTHISGTYETIGGKSYIYVNGVLKKEELTGKGTLSQDWNGRVSIGKFYDKSADGQWVESRALMGSMDEFYIFDRSLPQIEIKKLSETCNFKRVVMHFGFELFDGKVTYDQSGLANNGIAGGVVGASLYGKCGKALNMTKGEIKLSGKNVRGKPLEAISIAVWVSLQTNRGRQEIFNTIGDQSEHKHDQYDLAVDTGKVIWYHHEMHDKEVFNIQTLPVIPARVWTHIAATYNSTAQIAKVYINGKMIKQKTASGLLSQDWGHYAGIGKHFYHNDNYLNGMVDDFIMYNYELEEKEVKYLASGRCAR